MTARHAGYIVTLADDMREDDAEALTSAIRMLRGVVDVEPIHASGEIMIATARVRVDVQKRLLAVIREMFDRDN